MKVFAFLCACACAQALKTSAPWFTEPLREDWQEFSNFLRQRFGPQDGAAHEIPNRLVFNYKVDLLKHPDALPHRARNVQRIIYGVYKDMEIEFLDDEGCAAAIERAHSVSLAGYFRREAHGPYKSDTCRIAQLLEKGGYYMDNDLEVISDFREFVPAEASFVSVAHPRKDIFQALIGVAPGHPMLKHALDIMHDAYVQSHGQPVGLSARPLAELNSPLFADLNSSSLAEHNSLHAWLFGPEKLSEAYRWWFGEDVMNGVRHARNRDSFQVAYMFLEEDRPENYGLSRRDGSGGACNWVVGDPSTGRAAFYSRFRGAGDLCM